MIATIMSGDFFSSLFYEFRYAPLIIQIALVFIIIAILFTGGAYLSILLSRYNGYRRDKKLAKVNPIIDNLIFERIIMNDSIDPDIPINQVQLPLEDFHIPIFRKRWARQALIDRIINYRKNVRGKMGQLLRALYIQLELDKESYRKMKSSHWNKKVQALVEFTNMDMSISDVSILPLTNSSNRELRAAARHAYIKLSKNEPFKFFDVTTEPLLLWDQVELFKIITSTEDISIPNFAQWVTYSTNKSIISFCLKLIAHYNQLAAVPAVVKLLDTKDHYLRADAINCLGKLKVEEVENRLVNMYSSQPLICQIEILKAIGRINSGEHVAFLRQEFLHSTDFDLRKNAAKSLVRNEWSAKDMIRELLATSTPENLLILKHCMNPLIKF
jgi:hypothetical protein